VPAGTVSEQVICVTDMLATLANILSVPVPKSNAEDSFDISRAFIEKEPGPAVRDHVVVQSAHTTYAIRSGDWKLVEHTAAPHVAPRNAKKAALEAKRKKQTPQQDELFNLKQDPTEQTNVISANRELAAQLKQRLVEARDRGYTRPSAR
jgi:arylsulfatase A-like enzyme